MPSDSIILSLGIQVVFVEAKRSVIQMVIQKLDKNYNKLAGGGGCTENKGDAFGDLYREDRVMQ